MEKIETIAERAASKNQRGIAHRANNLEKAQERTVQNSEIITERNGHRNIHEALSAFQSELNTLPKSVTVEFKTKTGGLVKFSYTPLGEIMSVIYPLLGKHGLSIRHEISHSGGKDGVEAILAHSSYKEGNYFSSGEDIVGETEEADKHTRFIHTVEGEMRSGKIFITGGEMKEKAAAITYARRYTLTMLLGIASEEDLDAKLFEERADAAIGFAYSKAKQGIQGAKTPEDLGKATKILQSDLAKLESGSAGALGLDKKQYEELIGMAVAKGIAFQAEFKTQV